MWENPNEKNDSLQNILKNFDPYTVLEPLTPQGIPKENILVDLTDTNNDSNLELSGSLLDKSTKSDFEVIDVFQNLFVTPQHVNSNINGNKSKDKEWMKAFDGIDHRNNEEIDMKKELESIFTNTKKINATLTRLSDEFDVDIDEVLTMKRIDSIRLPQNDVVSTNYVVSESNVSNNAKTKDVNTDIITNDLQVNIPKANKHVNIESNFLLSKEFIIDKSNNEAKVNNFQLIKTIQLDKKKLQKKIVLPDDVKRNYTKGPDLVEKSIALPSMIARIKARQQVIENEKCLRHRLILEPDCPSFVPIIERTSYQFNPEVLTEDCNKQRLRALQAGKAFEKFVIGEK